MISPDRFEKLHKAAVAARKAYDDAFYAAAALGADAAAADYDAAEAAYYDAYAAAFAAEAALEAAEEEMTDE